MKQKMLERFKKNEIENAVFANMLNQSFAKLDVDNTNVFNEKFGIKDVKTLTKKEMKNILAEY